MRNLLHINSVHKKLIPNRKCLTLPVFCFRILHLRFLFYCYLISFPIILIGLMMRFNAKSITSQFTCETSNLPSVLSSSRTFELFRLLFPEVCLQVRSEDGQRYLPPRISTSFHPYLPVIGGINCWIPSFKSRFEPYFVAIV